MTDIPTSPEGQTPDMTVATPDIESLAHGADPDHREALGLDAQPADSETPLEEAEELFETGLPAGDTVPVASQADLDLLVHTPERTEIEGYSVESAAELAKNPQARELFVQLRELQAELAEGKAWAERFARAAEQYDVIITKLDDLLSRDTAEEPEPTPQQGTPMVEPTAEPVAEQPDDGMQIFTRGQQAAVTTPGWTQDPDRPGVMTRPVDEDNPADVGLRAQKIERQNQFAAMSAAAAAEAQARSDEIAAAQAKANEPIPGGINEMPFPSPAEEVKEPAAQQPIIDREPTAEELASLRVSEPAPAEPEAPQPSAEA
jgi:hypothetical protein